MVLERSAPMASTAANLVHVALNHLHHAGVSAFVSIACSRHVCCQPIPVPFWLLLNLHRAAATGSPCALCWTCNRFSQLKEASLLCVPVVQRVCWCTATPFEGAASYDDSFAQRRYPGTFYNNEPTQFQPCIPAILIGRGL